MTFVIVLLTALLIVDCLFLGLLILVQLPKKDAGVGMAFGGGAADALFGAGSGTALTKLTKYTATAFFILVFVLSYLNIHANPTAASELKSAYEKQSQAPAPSSPVVMPATASTNPVANPSSSNTAPPATNLLLIPPAATPNAGTNPPPASPAK
jgi:protein translocase SecG subunit